MPQQNLKNVLLCTYACGTLFVQERDNVDITAKKLLKRLEEIDRELSQLRLERDGITTALAVAGLRPPDANPRIYSHLENVYRSGRPFTKMSLTDACLKVLKDHAENADDGTEQWLDKNQVEYLIVRGGLQFKTQDATNSVNITLRRLADQGFCEAFGGKGSRAIKYRFVKDRLPNDVEDSGATTAPINSGSGQR